ncbi:MAG: alkaline phosphatase family protein, partial [Alphaproteobacteria bacterium]
MRPMRRRVLLVGCGSADWSLVHELAESGSLPTFQRLMDAGAGGPLKAAGPLHEAMLWTSIATGCRPRRHGVAASMEIRPDGGGVQPVGRRSWRVPALWDVLTGAGLRTAVVNWPASSPAAWGPGIIIDDRFAAISPDPEDWPLAPDCVAPADLRDPLRELRVHPADLSAVEIGALVPRYRDVDQARDARLVTIAAMLAETATVHAAATYLAARADWDLLAVHYRLLGRAQRAFMRYRAGTDAEAPLYGGVVDAAYRFVDMMVARLIELSGPDTDVIVVSERGCSPAHGTPRANGLLIASGPSFAGDRLVHGVGPFDIMPTILALFGQTPGGEGRVLSDALARPGSATSPAPAAETEIPDVPDDPSLSPEQARVLRDTRVATLVALAESQIALGADRDAIALLRRAQALQPDHVALPLLLARAHIGL